MTISGQSGKESSLKAMTFYTFQSLFWGFYYITDLSTRNAIFNFKLIQTEIF